MKVKLELHNSIAFLNKSTLLLKKGEPLEIAIKTKYNTDKLTLCLDNNGAFAVVDCKNNKFEVNGEVLFAGRLTGELRLYEDGKVIKSWKMPPLILSEVENKIETVKECEQFKIDILKELSALQERVDILEEKQRKKDNIKKFFSKGDK